MNKNYKINEQGRSMVEMLGVLAIIGVLSVGGISAYSTAMKKYKANELMAATMQEAVLISAQLATGKTNPTLSGINNSLFTSIFIIPNSYNFKLTLSPIDEEVCKNIQASLGGSSIILETSQNCSEMTFHKNLIPKKSNVSTDIKDTACQNIHCKEETSCFQGSCLENIDTGRCLNGNVFLSYAQNPCSTETPKNMECTKNSDCKNGQFCKFYAEVTERNPSGEITSSICSDLGNTRLSLASGNFTQGQFLIGPLLNWWSAENWCKAHKKRLATLSDLECDYDEKSCDDWSAIKNIYPNSAIIYWTECNKSRPIDVRPFEQMIGGDMRFIREFWALCL